MANTDNNCDHLKVGDRKFDQFDEIFQMQKDIQENTYGYKFNELSLKGLVSFLLMNKHALEDELSETFDALGGIHDGIGNAAWKPWKKDHKNTHLMKISGLTPRDRQELLMEIVDQFHFFMNQAVACGFTGSEIANAYVAKNKENIKRQKEGY